MPCKKPFTPPPLPFEKIFYVTMLCPQTGWVRDSAQKMHRIDWHAPFLSLTKGQDYLMLALPQGNFLWTSLVAFHENSPCHLHHSGPLHIHSACHLILKAPHVDIVTVL